MLTYTSLGGAAVSLQNSAKSLLIFPEKAEGNADLILLGVSEEEPKEGVISWPGEYDYDGVAIRGIGHDEGKRVSYSVEIDGIRSAFLSSPLREWTDHELELLGDVDVLFIPADNAKLAQKITDEVDPRVLIPVLTKDKETFEELLNACGAKSSEQVSEYKVKGKGTLPAEGREVVVLKAKK